MFEEELSQAGAEVSISPSERDKSRYLVSANFKKGQKSSLILTSPRVRVKDYLDLASEGLGKTEDSLSEN